MSGDQPQVRPDGLGKEPISPPASEASDGAASTAGDVPADGSVAARATSGAVPADGSAAATAAAAAMPGQDVSADAVATAESVALPPEAAPMPADPAATPADAAVAPIPAVATTPVVSTARRRGLAVVAGIGRLLRFALVVALFALGVAVGNQAFVNSQSAASRSAADPATVGKQPALVVQEFISAVGTNDADRIRSTVPAEPYKLFTSEIERWKFQQVTSVETLATYQDGPRAATAFVMLGLDTNGNPIAMDLIVETQDGNIVGFK